MPGTPNQRRVGWSELLASRAAAVAALVDDAPGAGNVGSGGKKGGAAGGGAVTDNPFYSTPFTGNWIVKVPATGEIWMLLSKSSPLEPTVTARPRSRAR